MNVQRLASIDEDASVEYSLPSSLSSILTSVGLLVITSNGVLELLVSSIDTLINNYYYYYYKNLFQCLLLTQSHTMTY